MIKSNHFYTKKNQKRKSPPENTSKSKKVQKDFDPSNTRLHLNKNLQGDDDNIIMTENAEPKSLETPQDSQETSDSER